MKFIINTTNLQTGGALQVALSLLEEWNQSNQAHEFHVLLSPQLASIIVQKDYKDQFYFYPFDSNPTTHILGSLFYYKKLNEIEEHIKPNAVFSVFGPALWQAKSPHLLGFANGIFLFDDSKYIRDKIKTNLVSRIQYYLRRLLLFWQLKKEGTQFWVETIIAQEKLAKTLKISLKKISVVGNTFQSNFENIKATEYNSEKPFQLLYASAYYPHKNFEVIPEVIKILAERNVAFQFVLTIDQQHFDHIFHDENVKKYVVNLGSKKPKELAAIYQNADALFMPSLLETFSANFPEAMKMQKPILCSDMPFAKAICNNAALYFNPKNARDIAEKTQHLINDSSLQKNLVERGKEQLKTMESPSTRAKKLLTLLEQIAKSK